MKIRGSSLFLIVIMLLAVAFIGMSIPLRYIDAKLLPIMFAGLILFIGAIELARELRTIEAKEEGRAVAAGVLYGTSLRRGVIFTSWILGFALGIYVLGFLIAIPLFVFSYVKSHGRSWHISIAVAVMTTVAIYGLFDYLLGVDLYRGLINVGLNIRF